MIFNASNIMELVKEGELYRNHETGALECYACAHRCKIRNGKQGICKVRYNKAGKLMVPHNYVAALHNDPVEKKPFYHAYPGSNAMSFGMLGCNLHCPYCQNWQISQVIRDSTAGVAPREITAENIVNYALSVNARSVVSTYNEPLITSEWSHEIFTLAKERGLKTGFVSSGNSTPEVLDYLSPVLDMYKIDFKTFNDKSYRKLGASLDKVLASIENVYHKGFWLELVTLLVPGFNDSDEEIAAMADFIYDLSPDIPWHITAYHTDYKMNNPSTETKQVLQAAEIAEKKGIYYVYAGNVRSDKFQSTLCPECDQVMVGRIGWQVTEYNLVDGKCERCDINIPGLWEQPPKSRRYFDLFS